MTAEARREVIDQAATEVFAERGYLGASIDEIARPQECRHPAPLLFDEVQDAPSYVTLSLRAPASVSLVKRALSSRPLSARSDRGYPRVNVRDLPSETRKWRQEPWWGSRAASFPSMACKSHQG